MGEEEKKRHSLTVLKDQWKVQEFQTQSNERERKKKKKNKLVDDNE